MRAVTYSTLGEARDVLTLTEMPTPTPAAGEVLVRLAVSGVNPSDVKSRRGRPGMTHPPFETVIPHSDGAGVIEAVGDGVGNGSAPLALPRPILPCRKRRPSRCPMT